MAWLQYQLADAKNDLGIKAAAGACSSSADFLHLVNSVTRRLLKRGNFFETEIVLRICVHGCRIVYPSIVSTVLGLRFCGTREQMPIHNKWWSIVGPRNCNAQWSSNIGVRDSNTVPTYREISGNTGKLIRYYVVKNEDIGKTITLYGQKYGGQPLQTKVGDVWEMGETVTAANPFGTSASLVTKIDSVVRQPTQGLAYLYEYDAATDQLRDLAVYYPNETNPRFRSSVIENVCSVPFCSDENGVKTARVDALVKLEYQPLVNDWDFLLIDNLDAIALGMQAIKLEQAYDMAGAEAMWNAAILELNMEDRNKNPDLQTSITCNVFGDGSPALMNPI